MLASRTASFTRSDEGYFDCGYAASFHRVAHAMKRTHLLRHRELVDCRVTIGLIGVEAGRRELGSVR